MSMCVEDILHEICKKLGFKQHKGNCWYQEKSDSFYCILASRNVLNSRIGLHHLIVQCCFKDYLDNPNLRPASNHFPISINIQRALGSASSSRFLELLDDTKEIKIDVRKKELTDICLDKIPAALNMLASKAVIREALADGAPISVLGPALEFKGKVWSKGWPYIPKA